jgi:hypothetical protein
MFIRPCLRRMTFRAQMGMKEGEALAIKINGDPDKVTTLSDDCRVLHIRTIIARRIRARQAEV